MKVQSNNFICEADSYEYWHQYYLRLINFVEYYKKGLDDQPTEEQINFNYDVEFISYKVATLYAEIDRVKILMSVLGYKYDTREIKKLDCYNSEFYSL